jgi:tripeptide aminopeptidase
MAARKKPAGRPTKDRSAKRPASKGAAKKPSQRAGRKRPAPPRKPRTVAPVDGPAVPNPTAARRLLMKLLSLPGVSRREDRVMRYIVDRLRRAGVPEEAIVFDNAHERIPGGGAVGNLICHLPGTVRGPRRMLMAHADTVPLCKGAKPVIREGIIVPRSPETALGADDRAGVAVLLSTALEIVGRGLPHPPLVFCFTVQEELGLLGARHAKIGLLKKPRLAFNFDGGSAEKLTVGATGGERMNIVVRGRPSHAGNAPEQGVSAIAVAALAIARLHREGWHGRVEKDGGVGTSNVGVIRGGEATNVVTPEVFIRAEARSHDPPFRERIVDAIELAFREAAQEVVNDRGDRATVEIQSHLDYESFKLPDDDPSVAAAESAVRTVAGNAVRAVCNGGLDANWMTARGIPTVTLGCGQRNGHTTDEQLDLAEFELGCRVALCLATAGEAG